LKHFMCFCGRFFKTETKSQVDSLFSTVRHHDFARGTWQHSPYNFLRRRPPGYWLVKGATTFT
jgi:hypothetical protein